MIQSAWKENSSLSILSENRLPFCLPTKANATKFTSYHTQNVEQIGNKIYSQQLKNTFSIRTNNKWQTFLKKLAP